MANYCRKINIPLLLNKRSYIKKFCLNVPCKYSTKSNNPFSKTWNLVSKEIPVLFGINKKPIVYPEHADVVIIGGGYIGSAAAYWLKTRAGDGLSIVVLEKDPSFNNAKINGSLGTLTQHFCLPENVHLAQYSAEFLRNIRDNLGSNININYCPSGHLVLASEKYAERLEHNVSLLKEFGVKSELLTVNDVKQRYPWINTKDIQLGCIGTESEGYFNSWALLKGLIQKSTELGATYINAEVVGFELEQQRDVLMEGIEPGSFKRINKVIYRTPDNEEYAIKFAACILTAGSDSGDIAKLAKIGTGQGLLAIPLPVESREEKIYCVEGTRKLGLNTPLVQDTSGLWLKNQALQNTLLCGHVPMPTVKPKDFSDNEYYETVIKPALANRCSDFENANVTSAISEVHDYNTFDETGILGPHPYHNNLIIAAGFGKYGCQNSPGIGKAITELIIDSNFMNIDLTRLTFDRIFTDRPLVEFNIY